MRIVRPLLPEAATASSAIPLSWRSSHRVLTAIHCCRTANSIEAGQKRVRELVSESMADLVGASVTSQAVQQQAVVAGEHAKAEAVARWAAWDTCCSAVHAIKQPVTRFGSQAASVAAEHLAAALKDARDEIPSEILGSNGGDVHVEVTSMAVVLGPRSGGGGGDAAMQLVRLAGVATSDSAALHEAIKGRPGDITRVASSPSVCNEAAAELEALGRIRGARRAAPRAGPHAQPPCAVLPASSGPILPLGASAFVCSTPAASHVASSDHGFWPTALRSGHLFVCLEEASQSQTPWGEVLGPADGTHGAEAATSPTDAALSQAAASILPYLCRCYSARGPEETSSSARAESVRVVAALTKHHRALPDASAAEGADFAGEWPAVLRGQGGASDEVTLHFATASVLNVLETETALRLADGDNALLIRARLRESGMASAGIAGAIPQLWALVSPPGPGDQAGLGVMLPLSRAAEEAVVLAVCRGAAGGLRPSHAGGAQQLPPAVLLLPHDADEAASAGVWFLATLRGGLAATAVVDAESRLETASGGIAGPHGSGSDDEAAAGRGGSGSDRPAYGQRSFRAEAHAALHSSAAAAALARSARAPVLSVAELAGALSDSGPDALMLGGGMAPARPPRSLRDAQAASCAATPVHRGKGPSSLEGQTDAGQAMVTAGLGALAVAALRQPEPAPATLRGRLRSDGVSPQALLMLVRITGPGTPGLEPIATPPGVRRPTACSSDGSIAVTVAVATLGNAQSSPLLFGPVQPLVADLARFDRTCQWRGCSSLQAQKRPETLSLLLRPLAEAGSVSQAFVAGSARLCSGCAAMRHSVFGSALEQCLQAELETAGQGRPGGAMQSPSFGPAEAQKAVAELLRFLPRGLFEPDVADSASVGGEDDDRAARRGHEAGALSVGRKRGQETRRHRKDSEASSSTRAASSSIAIGWSSSAMPTTAAVLESARRLGHAPPTAPYCTSWLLHELAEGKLHSTLEAFLKRQLRTVQDRVAATAAAKSAGVAPRALEAAAELWAGGGDGAGSAQEPLAPTGRASAVMHFRAHAALASLELAGIHAVLRREKEVDNALRRLATAGIHPEPALASIRDEFQHLNTQRQHIREAAESGTPPRSVIESLVREFAEESSVVAKQGKKGATAVVEKQQRKGPAEHRLARQASILTRLVSEDRALLARCSRVADLRLELQFCSFKQHAITSLLPKRGAYEGDDDFGD